MQRKFYFCFKILLSQCLYYDVFSHRKNNILSLCTAIVEVKVKVSHSLIAVGAVGVRVPLYLGHS